MRSYQSKFLQRGEIWTQTCTWGDHHVEMKSDTRVILLQADGHQGLPASQQEPGRGLAESPSWPHKVPVMPAL